MLETRRGNLRLVIIALVLAAGVAVAPLWSSLVLGVWFADILQPLVRLFERLFNGRRRGAAAIVVLMVVVVLVPLVALTIQVVHGFEDLLLQLRAALAGDESFAAVLFGSDGHSHPHFREWARLATRDPANAWRAFLTIAQTSTWVFLWALVFVGTLYTFASRGKHAYLWLARHTPLPHRAFTRFSRAFRETGRGILIGGGGTAILQGLTATIAYVAIGVPRAWLLGPLTAIAAIVPAVGTGLVWVPLAIELAATGDYPRAIAVALVGAIVISIIDNFVRPLLVRRGHLNLPTLVVLVSMLGGIAAFGAWGALLGPIVVRMAVEGLEIWREQARKPPITSVPVVRPVDGAKRSPRSLGRYAP